MEPPGSNGSGGGDGSAPPRAASRAEYARSAFAAIAEKRQQAMQERHRFQPLVHEQIQRLFAHYQPPLHARLRGYRRAQTLALAEETVSPLAAALGRPFTDEETQALTEHFLHSAGTVVAWKWAMTGFAAYMTYRGRRTWRFPLLRPRLDGRLNPVAAGPHVKLAWHSARFFAYYGVAWLLGEPVFQTVNFLYHSAAMDRDPRLTAMLRESKAQAQAQPGALAPPRHPQGPAGEQHPAADAVEQQQYGADGWGAETQTDRPAGQPPAQGAWPQPRQESPAAPSASPGDSWGSLPGDMDDASPAMPSAQAKQGAPAGSAWDRIRQQSSQHPPRRGPQQQQSWPEPQAAAGWGSDGDDASPQYRGARDSYSSSSADGDRAGVRGQAQREFDELLERERRGTDQGRASWGR